MRVGGVGATPEVAPIVDLEWPNGTLVKVQARLLNSSFLWPGPIDPWSGTPHPVVLFKFLISNVVSSNTTTQIADTGPCVCVGPDLRLKPTPPPAPPPPTSELGQLSPAQRSRLADAIFMQTAAAQSKQLYGPPTAAMRQGLQTDIALELLLTSDARRRGSAGAGQPAASPSGTFIVSSTAARDVRGGFDASEPATAAVTQPPDDLMTQPPGSQKTQPPATQPAQVSGGQTTQPPSIQMMQPPASQVAQVSASQLAQPPASQLTQPPASQLTQPPGTLTQPPDGVIASERAGEGHSARAAPSHRTPDHLKRARRAGGHDVGPSPHATAENRGDNVDGAALQTTAGREQVDGGRCPAATTSASDSPLWGLPWHPKWRWWYQSWLHSQQAALVTQRPRGCDRAELYTAATARATAQALLDHWLVDNRTLGDRTVRAAIELKDFTTWQALPLAMRSDLQPVFTHPLILRDLCVIKPFVSKDRSRVLFKLSLKGRKSRNVVLSPELMQSTAGACIAANAVLMARINNPAAKAAARMTVKCHSTSWTSDVA